MSKAELMRLPKGTLFADYRDEPGAPWPAGPEMILDSICEPFNGSEPVDFFFTTFGAPDAWNTGEMFDCMDDMAENGASHRVGLYPQREGLYDPETRYLVWEPEDVARIINLLNGGDDQEGNE